MRFQRKFTKIMRFQRFFKPIHHEISLKSTKIMRKSTKIHEIFLSPEIMKRAKNFAKLNYQKISN